MLGPYCVEVEPSETMRISKNESSDVWVDKSGSAVRKRHTYG